MSGWDMPPGNLVSLRIRLEREPAQRWLGVLSDAIHILPGPEFAALRRAFAETLQQKMKRSWIAELMPGLLGELRKPTDEGDLVAI